MTENKVEKVRQPQAMDLTQLHNVAGIEDEDLTSKGPSTHGEEFGGEYSTTIRRQRI